MKFNYVLENLIDVFLRKTISRQRNPSTVFLQDGACGSFLSLQTSTEIKLPKSMEWTYVRVFYPLSYDITDIVQTVINGDPDRNGFTFDMELHLPFSYR